ncbi:helix-turn-helix transcriptional regulator [Gordonibacter sp. An230]|uniref:response regulator transcription factor n=1 Tax=Gordonibacter sp. An230 TaxID=1965592 RepID=UPI000B39E47D|nr:helix-turn-helix transcriptional regulator [Gordonibacter sp. An230]OUO91289.1 helix-turn-helix transcriptional regulator [Gordonibacter sp. An230]
MSNTDQIARTNTLTVLTDGPFLPSFLGLAATRVWLQSNLFASYTQSDDGMFTIVNQLFYGLAMVVGGAMALHKPFSKRARTAVAWLGFAIMTFSTVLILAGKEANAVAILVAASVSAGIGSALGGGMWTAAYARLGLRQSVLYGFLSLALGSVGGLVLSFLPETLGYTTSMFMPAIALLCYQRAMKADVGAHPAPEPVYDREPRTTMLFIFGGLAVFGLALGVSRGFPAGEPVPMDATQRIVHQMGVVVISLFVIWWFIVKRKRLSFSFLWRIEIMLVAAGMLVLSVLPGHFTGLAIAVVNIADTLMLGVLWVTLQDVARHTTTDVYAVYGFAWASRILSRDAGRVLVMALGTAGLSSYAVTAVIGIVVFALAVSMALLLSDGIPRLRPLFEQDERRTHEDAGAGSNAKTTSAGAANAEGGGRVDAEKAPGERSGTRCSAKTQADATMDGSWLRDAFDLSERETQVALLIAQGRSKAYIADTLFLSENTVRTHAKNAYAKMGVHSKQDLIDLVLGGK